MKRKNRAPRAVKAGAVSMTGLVAGGLVLASYSHAAESAAHKVVADVLLAAGSIVFIDGNNYPNGSTRMAGELEGMYQPQPPDCTAPCGLTTPAAGTNYVFINNTAVYPGTLGLYNGLGAPSGNQSIADGQAAIVQDIAQQEASGDTPVTVFGYSEGAVAASNEVANYGSSNVNFVLIGDPENPDGGILARLPTGTYIPLLGITADGPTSSSGAPVVIVTQEYEGVADAPAYPLNVVADANAALGAYYLHGDYEDVNPNAPTNIVTTSGNMTEILVPAPVGDLPVEMPLAAAGVPQPILVALDPALRAIINTGYPPSSPDVAGAAGNPAQQVEFALLPPPTAWAGDVQSVATGVLVTVQELPGAVVASVGTIQLPSVPALTSPQTTSPVSSVPTALTSAATLSASPMKPTMAKNEGTPETTVAPQNSPTPRTRSTSTTDASPGPGSSKSVTNSTKPTTVGAVTSVTHAIGSLTGSLTKSTSTGSTSSHAAFASSGAGSHHKS